MKIVRKSLAQIMREGGGHINRAAFDALTDEDIARQIAEDPDVAPSVETLGPPLPYARTVRNKLGLTQAELAEKIHVPVATIRNWEQGRVRPDPAALALLRILDRAPKAALKALAG